MHDGMSLEEHVKQEADHAGLDRGLRDLVADTAKACGDISALVRHGALAGNLSADVGTNVQDETQKELDVRANEILMDRIDEGGNAIAVASEEMEDSHVFARSRPRSAYLLVFDPLDGSGNIAVNGSVGTIFSVLRAPQDSVGEAGDFLQAGRDQVAAGYVLYGPSSELVITFGHGVNRFTLDPRSGDFIRTGAMLRIPEHTGEFAVNASNRRHWEAPVRRYVDECLAGRDGPRGSDFNMRWAGAMVADVHRCLTRGGIFMYPIDEKTRDRGGRLRLLYEANPMSMIVEQAGGVSSTARERILDVQPRGLHQRVPVITGSRKEVERVIDYHRP